MGRMEIHCIYILSRVHFCLNQLHRTFYSRFETVNKKKGGGGGEDQRRREKQTALHQYDNIIPHSPYH